MVVAGYGWVGRGIARRFAGLGGHVAVVEVDPIRALEALMDGYEVLTASQAAPWGEIFITATGNINVFRREHFSQMRDGAILANSGHFDAELDLAAQGRPGIADEGAAPPPPPGGGVRGVHRSPLRQGPGIADRPDRPGPAGRRLRWPALAGVHNPAAARPSATQRD